MTSVRTRVRAVLVGTAFVGAAAAPAVASAQSVMLGATLNQAQEVPPSGSPATGFGTLMWNAAGGGTLMVQLSFTGLTSQTIPVPPPSGAPAHIHFAPPGSNGPIVLPLSFVPVGVTSFSGSSTFSGAALNADLVAELNRVASLPVGTFSNLYFNVHTSGFAGGEIRGNLAVAVVPEPSTYALVGAGLAGVAGFARRRRRA